MEYTNIRIKVSAEQGDVDTRPAQLSSIMDEIRAELDLLFKKKSERLPFTFELTEEYPE